MKPTFAISLLAYLVQSSYHNEFEFVKVLLGTTVLATVHSTHFEMD